MAFAASRIFEDMNEKMQSSFDDHTYLLPGKKSKQSMSKLQKMLGDRIDDMTDDEVDAFALENGFEVVPEFTDEQRLAQITDTRKTMSQLLTKLLDIRPQHLKDLLEIVNADLCETSDPAKFAAEHDELKDFRIRTVDVIRRLLGFFSFKIFRFMPSNTDIEYTPDSIRMAAMTPARALELATQSQGLVALTWNIVARLLDDEWIPAHKQLIDCWATIQQHATDPTCKTVGKIQSELFKERGWYTEDIVHTDEDSSDEDSSEDDASDEDQAHSDDDDADTVLSDAEPSPKRTKPSDDE